MSAEWQVRGPESWKITLPCDKAEAERLEGEVAELADLDPQPVLMASEVDEAAGLWRLDIYLEQRPDPALIARLRALVPSAGDAEPAIETVEDADWVTISQKWLEPIRAGRFFVHTAAHAGDVPADMVAFHIEAGRAFGTGHHETTTGCLEMLDRLAGQGRAFADIIDVGTGTGLLAFAARALWPAARLTASDIDPVSIEVTAVNMAANAIPDDAIALAAAPGFDDPRLAARAPYDLIVANILAAPLIALAPAFAAASREGTVLVLAGLLTTQAEAVTAACTAAGFMPLDRIVRGDWPTLALIRCG